MQTERTDRVWFSYLLRHLARKWSGSILTTPEPAGAVAKEIGWVSWSYDAHDWRKRGVLTGLQLGSDWSATRQRPAHSSLRPVFRLDRLMESGFYCIRQSSVTRFG